MRMKVLPMQLLPGDKMFDPDQAKYVTIEQVKVEGDFTHLTINGITSKTSNYGTRVIFREIFYTHQA